MKNFWSKALYRFAITIGILAFLYCVFVIISSLICREGSTKEVNHFISILELLVLTATLLALIKYTADNAKAAEASMKQAKIAEINYYAPVVGFQLGPVLKQISTKTYSLTALAPQFTNTSNTYSASFIKLSLTINGQQYPCKAEQYNGEYEWILGPYAAFRGNVGLTNDRFGLEITNIGNIKFYITAIVSHRSIPRKTVEIGPFEYKYMWDPTRSSLVPDLPSVPR